MTLNWAPVAQRGLVVDAATGAVLWSREADATAPVASVQKLLAAVLIAEAGGLEREVEIAAEDIALPPVFRAAMAGVQPGQRHSRQSLLAAMLVGSANDAAMALARDHSGSAEAFAAAMTQRARELGMRDSRFVNPHGLPAEGQAASARDVGVLALAVDRMPLLRSLAALTQTAIAAGNVPTVLRNTNRLLTSFAGCDGMKTGFTRAAGACLVASADMPAGRRIAIVLGSTPEAVWDDARMLLTGTP